nr:integrase, catalytic region, zinc finger, CCHC-type, peptidase aspartic, catalytic [Tanacetum cinerariifolium]
MIEKKIITKPINYAILNQLSTDFKTRFVPQTESSAEQAFWSQYSVQTDKPNLSRTTIVAVLKELPKVSMELFTSFDQCLIDEVTEVQNVFTQIELAVEQHCEEKTKGQITMENVLQENDQILTQALSVEIVNIVVHENMKSVCFNVTACARCVTTGSELKPDFLKKECYEMLLQKYQTLEKHCITSEINNQLNMEIFQRDTLFSYESAPTFVELFKINDLKAQAQAKDTVILKLKEKLNSLNGDVKERKVKREVEEIETLNIELDHKVTKLAAKNEHLKPTYKQLYDSIKSSRVRSKEQCDDLINKVNLKSAEVSNLSTSLQEKVLVITALREQLNKLKGKAVLTEAISLNPIDPELLKVDVAPLVPKLRKNRTAHTDYIRHTPEEATTLREIVKSERLLSPLYTSLVYACKYTRRIQELLMIIQQTCPCLTDIGTKLVAVIPKNKTKQIRHTAQVTKSESITVTTSTSTNLESNKPVLSSTGVNLVSSASGSLSQDNTKNNRIRRTQKNAKKNKVEDHLRIVKSSLNKESVVDSKATSSVLNSVLNVNSDLKCASCNECLFSDNHDACAVDYMNYAVQIVLWYLDSGCSKHMTGDRSQLVNFVQKFLGMVKFGNDHVAKIMGYGDYQIRNVTISRRDTWSSQESAPTFAELFEINNLKAQAQAKDTVILKLKEKLNSLNVDVKERKVKRDVEEIETLNIELDHKEKVMVITTHKVQLNKLKGNAVLTEAVSLNPIDPELLKVNVAPLVPKLRKNWTAHTDYIRHTQEEAATLREIVESERLLSPLNTSLVNA